MKHIGTQNLTTQRLILRKFDLNDVAYAFNNWTSDDKVTTFLTWQTHKNTDETRQIIASWIEDYKKDDFYQWAIVLKEINQPIGTISVVRYDDRKLSAEIGYCIGSKWWHNGYVSEALKSVISFLFESVGVNRIMAKHDTQNPNSGKVMQKSGMTYEGTLRQADRNNRGIVDVCVYSVLAKEYFKL